MKDEIKERLLKGCGCKVLEGVFSPFVCGCIEDLKHPDNILLCSKCKAKIQQHRETKKTEKEKFLRFLKEETTGIGFTNWVKNTTNEKRIKIVAGLRIKELEELEKEE